jgi:hypothetical protein
MPEGGDQEPSEVLATRTPEPPAPETQSPVRIVVKMARPFAFLMTCGVLLGKSREVQRDGWTHFWWNVFEDLLLCRGAVGNGGCRFFCVEAILCTGRLAGV